MARILVTGGHGFLGGHLVQALGQGGHVVRALVRPGRGSLLPPGAVEAVEADVRDAPAVERATAGQELVVHTVSNFRRGGSDRSSAQAINVEGTLNVARAAAAAGARQLVHCSTIGVHGDVREPPANELTPFNPGDLYQRTKLEAEQRLRDLSAASGLPVTIVRPISMYGPGDRRMLKLFRLIKRRRFVMVGPGTALFQPAYVDDVVAGFLLCLDNPRALGEVFIVGGEEALPLRELYARLARALGVPGPRLSVPLAPVAALARLCERVCVPLGIEPPLHPRRVSFFRNNRSFDLARARAVLGFRPRVTLDEGLRRTIRWYETQGWL